MLVVVVGCWLVVVVAVAVGVVVVVVVIILSAFCYIAPHSVHHVPVHYHLSLARVNRCDEAACKDHSAGNLA